MSLSFLDRQTTFALACAVLGLSVLGARPSAAADSYFVPGLEAGLEYHTNVGLRSGTGPFTQEEDGGGYIAEVWALAGMRSPRAYFEVLPRIRFQEYPDHDELQDFSQFMAIRGRYDSPRSYVALTGDYLREDEFNAQLSDAQYDDFDPDNPVVDETGRVVLLDTTRTRVQLRPEFAYQLNRTISAGIRGLYQTVGFDSEVDFDRDDYSYAYAVGFLGWRSGPRSKLEVGPYVARYETDDNLNRTDSTGVAVGFDYQWSPTWTASVTGQIESTEVNRIDLLDTETSTNWGLMVETRREGQISDWRFSLGRTFNPSDSGTRTELDQIRAQYNRNLTQRWRFTGAIRAYQARSQGGNFRGNDRDYLRGDLGIEWRWRQTWSLRGEYSYIEQKYENDGQTRSDNMLQLKIRYEGLRPAR